MMENYQDVSPEKMIANFCEHFDVRPGKVEIERNGFFGLASAGKKNLSDIVSKVWRKMAEANIPDEVLDKHPEKGFDLIRDYARCSVVVSDFRYAAPILENLIKKFGGEISVHNRDTYKAFHLHTQIDGINCEIQVHTPETLALKKATDASYAKWRDAMAKHPEETKNNPDYIAENDYMKPMCQVIYDRSGFAAALKDVEALQRYNQPVPPMQLNNMLLIERQANAVQDILVQGVNEVLAATNAKIIDGYLSTDQNNDAAIKLPTDKKQNGADGVTM